MNLLCSASRLKREKGEEIKNSNVHYDFSNLLMHSCKDCVDEIQTQSTASLECRSSYYFSALAYIRLTPTYMCLNSCLDRSKWVKNNSKQTHNINPIKTNTHNGTQWNDPFYELLHDHRTNEWTNEATNKRTIW